MNKYTLKIYINRMQRYTLCPEHQALTARLLQCEIEIYPTFIKLAALGTHIHCSVY